MAMDQGIKPAIQRLLERELGVDEAYWLIGLTSDAGIRTRCTDALQIAFVHELKQLHDAVRAADVTLAKAMRIIRHMHIHMYCRTVTDAMKIRCLDEILETVKYVEQTCKDELEREGVGRHVAMLAHYRASAGTKHAELDANIIT